MIPPEAHGPPLPRRVGRRHNDPGGAWVCSHHPRPPQYRRNRDRKATLNQARPKQPITWLFHNAPLPPNVLLQLDTENVQSIMTTEVRREESRRTLPLRTGRYRQRSWQRWHEQDDYMKRVRANGGARTAFRREGIISLASTEPRRAVARALGVPVPGPGESVSARVAPARAPGPASLKSEGQLWKLAGPATRL